MERAGTLSGRRAAVPGADTTGRGRSALAASNHRLTRPGITIRRRMNPKVDVIRHWNASADLTARYTGCKKSGPKKSPGSWKASALGVTAQGKHAELAEEMTRKLRWSPTFENSDYRKYHDAVQEHRMVVTREILPAYGIRLARLVSVRTREGLALRLRFQLGGKLSLLCRRHAGHRQDDVRKRVVVCQ